MTPGPWSWPWMGFCIFFHSSVMDAFVGTDSAIGGPNSQESDSLERPERHTSMADELASSKVESELKDEHDIDVLELGGVVESLSRISVHAQDSLPASPLRSRSHSFSDEDVNHNSSTTGEYKNDERESVSSAFVDANIGTNVATSVLQKEEEDSYASISPDLRLNVSTMSETLLSPSEMDTLDNDKEVIAALSGGSTMPKIPEIQLESVASNENNDNTVGIDAQSSDKRGTDKESTTPASPLKETISTTMSSLRIDVPAYEPKSFQMLPPAGVHANYTSMQSDLLPEQGHGGMGREQYSGVDQVGLDTSNLFRRGVDNPYDLHHSLEHSASMVQQSIDMNLPLGPGTCTGIPGSVSGLDGHGNYTPTWSPNAPSPPQRHNMYYSQYGFDPQTYQPGVDNTAMSPLMPPPGMDNRGPLTSRAMPDSLNQSPYSSQTPVGMNRAPPGMLSPTTMQGSPYLGAPQQDQRVNQYYSSPSSQAMPPAHHMNSQQSHSNTQPSPQSNSYYQQSPSKRVSPGSGGPTGGGSSTGSSSKDRGGGDMTRESADNKVYQVRFKRASRNFSLHQLAPRDINVGDFVRVEADRGEDLGVVQTITPLEHFIEETPTAGYRGRGFSSGVGERKWLYRLATTTERLQIRDKVEDEQVALQVINRKILERGLHMRILDAEYQFDRHKLVFFFEANHRIDFRELVSELFSLYKTRIWMQQVETSFLDEDDPGVELAKQTGLLLPSATAESSLVSPSLSMEYDSNKGQSNAPMASMTSTSDAPLLASMDTVRDSEAMAMNQNLRHYPNPAGSHSSSRHTSRTTSPNIGGESMTSPSFKERGGNGNASDSSSSSGNGRGGKGSSGSSSQNDDSLFLSQLLEDEKEASSDDDSRSYRHSPSQVHKQNSPVRFRHL